MSSARPNVARLRTARCAQRAAYLVVFCALAAIAVSSPASADADAKLAGAPLLSIPSTTTSSTVGLQHDFFNGCSDGAASDTAYKLVVSQQIVLSLDTVGSSFDTALALLHVEDSLVPEVACNDNSGLLGTSALTYIAPPGTYYVIVDGASAAEGSFVLHVSATAGPDQKLANAPIVVPPTAVAGNTTSAGSAFSDYCFEDSGSQEGPDVMFRVSITKQSLLRVDTIGASFDTVVALGAFRYGEFDTFTCSDNYGGAQTSLLEEEVNPGTYYIIVDGNFGASGSFTLHVSATLTAASKVTSATQLSLPTSISGDTSTLGNVFDSSCGRGGGPEAVYRFTVATASVIEADTFGSAFDSVLYFRRNPPGSTSDTYREVDCNDNAAYDVVQSRLYAELNPGTYYVFVDGAKGGKGRFTLTIRVDPKVLSVGLPGTGLGRVTSQAPGIDCGATCDAEFSKGSAITLVANPDLGSSFSGWSGVGGCGVAAECVLTLNEDLAVSATFDDVAGPEPPHFLAPSPFVLSTRIPLAWHATDNASGVARYAVRYRHVPQSGRFTTYVRIPVAGWKERYNLAGADAGTYCFSGRAWDSAGNVSMWGSEQCTAVPLDDRGLKQMGGWEQGTSNKRFAGTFVATTTRGAKLRTGIVTSRQVALLVTMCSACGPVTVRFGNQVLGTVDTSSPTTRYRQLVVLPPFNVIRTGRVTIESVTQGRRVEVDGIYSSPIVTAHS